MTGSVRWDKAKMERWTRNNLMQGPGCWLYLKSRDRPTLKLWSGPHNVTCHKSLCKIVTVSHDFTRRVSNKLCSWPLAKLFKMKLRLADALKNVMTSLTVPTALRTLSTDDDLSNDKLSAWLTELAHHGLGKLNIKLPSSIRKFKHKAGA